MVWVLFACVHNAGRSQMAEALFNRYANPARAQAISAGTHPAAHVHPEVVTLMKDRGIDLSNKVPQRLTEDLAKQAHWLITMGCGDECPVVPGVKRDDWPLADPKNQTPQRVQAIADEIDARVRTFIAEHGFGF